MFFRKHLRAIYTLTDRPASSAPDKPVAGEQRRYTTNDKPLPTRDNLGAVESSTEPLLPSTQHRSPVSTFQRAGETVSSDARGLGSMLSAQMSGIHSQPNRTDTIHVPNSALTVPMSDHLSAEPSNVAKGWNGSSKDTATRQATMTPNSGSASASRVVPGIAPSAMGAFGDVQPITTSSSRASPEHNIAASAPAPPVLSLPLNVTRQHHLYHSGIPMSAQQSGDSESPRATATSAPTTPSNALDILLSALPTGVVESIESQYSLTFPDPTTSTQRTATTRQTSRPTTTSQPTSRTRTPSSTTSRTSSLSTPSTTSATSTFSTNTILPSTSLTNLANATATPAPTGHSQVSNGAIAGIAIGVTAAAVLIIMGVVLLLRRKKQGRAPFGPRNSVRSRGSGRAYPEVAWLYDPAPTPPMSPQRHHRNESRTSLLPQQPLPVAREMMAVSNAGSPQLRPVRAESPLLPPQVPPVRGEQVPLVRGEQVPLVRGEQVPLVRGEQAPLVRGEQPAEYSNVSPETVSGSSHGNQPAANLHQEHVRNSWDSNASERIRDLHATYEGRYDARYTDERI